MRTSERPGRSDSHDPVKKVNIGLPPSLPLSLSLSVSLFVRHARAYVRAAQARAREASKSEEGFLTG